MSKINIATESDRVLCEESSARTRDLSTRERVNFVVDSSIMNQLRTVSKNENMPMSRIIDSALTAYLGMGSNKTEINIVSECSEILLQHLLEIIIHETVETKRCSDFINQINEFFINFIYSNCLLNVNSPGNTRIGTKVMLFISNQDGDQLTKLLNYISLVKDHMKIEVRLDNEVL